MYLEMFIAINITAFLLFAYDKRCAIRHAWRVPEKILLAVCFFGGAMGGYLAMHLCHHKTHKWKFKLGVPVMVLMHASVWLTCINV